MHRVAASAVLGLAACALAACALAACALAACSEAMLEAPELVITPSLTAVSCTAGDTVVVGVTISGATSPPQLSYAARGGQVVATPGNARVSLFCAQAGQSAVTITVTSGRRTATATLPVAVAPAPSLDVSVVPATVACRAGDVVPVIVHVAGGRTGTSLTFAATGPSASATAADSGAAVSCLVPGDVEVVITASSGVQRGVARVPVTVGPPPPLDVHVAPAQIACNVGQTVVVRATVTGLVSPQPLSMVYSSSTAHAAVAGNGATATVRCLSTGPANLVVVALAGLQDGSVTVPIAVSPPPQTIVLFATPKFMARDFADPDSAVARFLKHYAPLTSRAARTIVVFAVGNSQHILTYRGPSYWQDTVAWARYTDGKKTFDQILRYDQLARIFHAFKRQGTAAGLDLAVYDQIDPGNEMTWEVWKFDVHPECMDMRWISYDIRGHMKPDDYAYASAPNGAPAGKLCGEFIADQSAAYMRDMALDGILYGNQFGTRGRWLPDSGDGFSDAEAAAIDHFLQYSKRVYGGREIMWFDSYNNTQVEHDTWSFPSDGYGYFDYIMASGFCVITVPGRYLDDLESKLALPNRPRILATLDYVDPWYTYNSMTAFPDESAGLEQIALDYRDRIDGLVFFANDEQGNLVPANLIASFAERFFGPALGTPVASRRSP